MILTGPEIERQVKRGTIEIDPFDHECLNPNSYNYHLGSEMLLYARQTLDAGASRHPTYRVTLDEHGHVFRPGMVHLCVTREAIGSSEFVPSLIGRSSLGRLGVFLQVAADLGNLGATHKWTLEIVVCQPVILYAGMRIGQVSFWRTEGERSIQYGGLLGRMNSPTGPLPSSSSDSAERGAHDTDGQ